MESLYLLRLFLILIFINKVSAFCVSPNSESTSKCEYFATYVNNSSIYFQSNSEFYFHPGVHLLKFSIVAVNQVNNISFIGNAGTTINASIIECHGSSGFIFNGTTNLTIANLTLVGCTILQQDQNASVYLMNVSNVLIDGVTIQYSSENGISVSSATGYFFVQHSLFQNILNTAIYSINSGISILTSVFNSCGTATHSVLQNINISGCSFVQNNVSMRVDNATYYGVGLSSEFSEVYINDCLFGNLTTALELDYSRSVISMSTFRDSKSGIIITGLNGMGTYTTVESCIFTRMVLNPAIQSTCSDFIFVHSCDFTDVHIGVYARNGLYNTISECAFDNSQSSSTYFSAGVVTFEVANVCIDFSTFNYISCGVTFYGTALSTITNSTFKNNENAGIFQLGKVNITDCLFTNYSNTALIAISNTISLSGNTSFLYGRSLDDGGALYLLNAIVTLVAPANITFINNSASIKGGAIYAEYILQPNRLDNSAILNTPCFLQYYDLYGTLNNPGIRIYFENNFASESGSTIYGLRPDCSLGLSFVPNYMYGTTAINILSALSNLPINSTQLATDPFLLCVVDGNNETQCPPNSIGVYNFSLYPGQSIHLSFVTIDDYNGKTPAIVYVYVHDSINLAIVDTFRTGKKPVAYELSTKLGSKTLYFVTDATSDNFFNDLNNGLNITIQILPCPFGFILGKDPEDGKSTCTCGPFLQNQTGVSCNITDVRIYSPLQSWVGNISDGQLAFYEYCSYDLCVETTSVQLTDQDEQCRNNRSGVLCGSCKANLSEVFGKPQCMNCSNWYLFLILPFAIMGVALVALLLVLNLTVSNGMINGFIFYANIVKLNNSYFLPITASNPFTSFLSTLIAWLNLDLGIVTCFYDGMNIYAKVWLQFVFPAYILSLVGGIIVAGKYSATISKLCRHSVVPVLATLVLLCYTKLLSNVIIIFSFDNLIVDGTSTPLSVWQYDGNVAFFDTKHALLFVVGLVVAVFFITPYMLLMLFSPILLKLSHLKVVSWINKLKPFLDCYEAPFLPKHRFCTGILLIARIIISTTKAINFSEKDSFNMVINIVVVLFLLVYLTRFKIYKSWLICITEMFLHINFILLCLFRLLFQNTFYSNGESENEYEVTYSLGVGSAVVVFFGIIIYRVYGLIRKQKAPEQSADKDMHPEVTRDVVNYTIMELSPDTGDQMNKNNSETPSESRMYREVLLSM